MEWPRPLMTSGEAQNSTSCPMCRGTGSYPFPSNPVTWSYRPQSQISHRHKTNAIMMPSSYTDHNHALTCPYCLTTRHQQPQDLWRKDIPNSGHAYRENDHSHCGHHGHGHYAPGYYNSHDYHDHLVPGYHVGHDHHDHHVTGCHEHDHHGHQISGYLDTSEHHDHHISGNPESNDHHDHHISGNPESNDHHDHHVSGNPDSHDHHGHQIVEYLASNDDHAHRISELKEGYVHDNPEKSGRNEDGEDDTEKSECYLDMEEHDPEASESNEILNELVHDISGTHEHQSKQRSNMFRPTEDPDEHYIREAHHRHLDKEHRSKSRYTEDYDEEPYIRENFHTHNSQGSHKSKVRQEQTENISEYLRKNADSYSPSSSRTSI